MPGPALSAHRRRVAVVAFVVAAVVASVTGLAPLPTTTPSPASAAEAWHHEMLGQLNAYRAANGRGPLTMCANLNEAARAHSQDQANRGVLSHTGSDGSNVGQRVRRTSYGSWTSVAENVAVGYSSVGAVMAGWKGSGGHDANLLARNVTHVGFGRATGSYGGHSGMIYWTQNFAAGGRCTPATAPVNNPVGSLDAATSPQPGRLRVKGWALDRDAGTASIQVHVYVGAVGHVLGPANKRRDDVAAAYGLGAYHGFDATVSAAPGSHRVCAYGINVGSGGNSLLGCRTVWVPDPASPYRDVLSSNPFFDAIVWLRNAGITGGYGDGTFRADEPTTRQAMAAFLYRAAGSPNGPFPNPGFRDVGASHPFRTEIAWMAHTDLSNGYGDGTFRPGATVSRQATVAFLHRLSQSPNPPPGSTGFRDVPAGHTFRRPILWASGSDITNGWPDGTFRPGQPVTRQAMAAFLYRWYHS